MPVELSEFNPASVSALSDAIVGEVGAIGGNWWVTNAALVEGYIKSLSEAAMQTASALASGTIKPTQADQIMKMQEVAFKSTIQFTKFMTFALAQKVLDTVFRLVGWAIRNRTGVNLFPGVVQP